VTKEHVMWALAAMGAILAMAAAYLQGGAIAALSAGSAACLSAAGILGYSTKTTTVVTPPAK